MVAARDRKHHEKKCFRPCGPCACSLRLNYFFLRFRGDCLATFLAFFTVFLLSFMAFAFTLLFAGCLFATVFALALIVRLAAGFAAFFAVTAPGLWAGLIADAATSYQPWSFRTAIMAARMLFHVCCFIITP